LLLLLIIKLWISAAVHGLVGITEPNHLVGGLNLGFAALAGVAAYLLNTKNPKGVTVAKIFLAVDAVYYLLALLDSALGDKTEIFRRVLRCFRVLFCVPNAFQAREEHLFPCND
jgi:hypothetical protein